MPWLERFADRVATPEEAVATIRSGQRVFVGSGAAEPQALVTALAARGRELADTQIVHVMTLGVAPYTDTRLQAGFRHNAFFIGANVRDAVAEARADYTPVFLSEIPRLFRGGRLPVDVALIQVSPPDRHGFMSYGVSVDIVKSAAESARRVIAQVNPRMPRVHGDAFIHVSRVATLVPVEEEILEATHGPPDDVAARIGRHIAALIEDGSTLQTGIGTIPDAVLAALTTQRDLGIHTEMFSDGVIDLVERGILNGRRKRIHAGKIVASFVLGSRRLYDWIDDNPMIEFHPTEYTNDPYRIAQHDKMVSINSALEVDLTGQVCADSIGEYFYSGIGGQVDFVRGASRSEGGKAIIALPATAEDGAVSRIVSSLRPGAGVVTSRGDVHYVVTEFGAVNLHGKTIRERALALIHIAHPRFRDELMAHARDRHLVPPDQVAVLGAGAPELDELESHFVARNGRTLHVRPIRPTDEDGLREAFYKLSDRSLYQRFLRHMKAVPYAALREKTAIDYHDEMALVAVYEHDECEDFIGAARYVLAPASGAADVAFLVLDEWQGTGVGTYLFERLLDVARSRGIVAFTADVLATNVHMLHIFHKGAPTPIRSRLEDGVYRLRFDLETG